MTDLRNFEFFTWGYPGPKEKQEVYALYQPTLDGFLLLSTDLESIKQSRILLSSRYLLCAVQIDCADNYVHNLVDNTVSERWSLSNKHDIDVPRSFLSYKLTKAQGLTQSDPKISWNIEKEKRWALMIQWWMMFLSKLETQKIHYAELDRTLNSFLCLDNLGNYYEIKNKIFRSLYLGTQIDQTLEEIQDHISKNPIISTFYENFPKDSLR